MNKNKQMWLHQAKKLLYSERNDQQQQQKAAYWMGEDICKWYIPREFNIQNI